MAKQLETKAKLNSKIPKKFESYAIEGYMIIEVSDTSNKNFVPRVLVEEYSQYMRLYTTKNSPLKVEILWDGTPNKK